MKLTKIAALITLLISINLNASKLNNIDKIVEAINITKDIELKIALVEQLDKQLQGMEKKELFEALNLINKKLIVAEEKKENNI